MSELTNLFKEVDEVLGRNGKCLSDIRFIMGGGYEISIEDFVRIAAEVNYYGGYGHQYIPEDMMIVGDDWWLERGEYDGTEWWEFKRLPERPERQRRLARLDIDRFSDDKYVWEV